MSEVKAKEPKKNATLVLCAGCKTQATTRHAERIRELANLKVNLKRMVKHTMKRDTAPMRAKRQRSLVKQRQKCYEMLGEIQRRGQEIDPTPRVRDPVLDQEERQAATEHALVSRIPEWDKYYKWAQRDEWWRDFCHETHGKTCTCRPTWGDDTAV